MYFYPPILVQTCREFVCCLILLNTKADTQNNLYMYYLNSYQLHVYFGKPKNYYLK